MVFNSTPPLAQLPGWTPTGSVTSNDPRGILPFDQPVEAPAPDPDVQRWDQYVEQIKALILASAGSTNKLAREQLQAQLADAEKGRQNALAIAHLNAETSRYGVDVGRQNLLAQLKENARQFDARHDLEQRQFGLDQQRLGLDYAKTATEYLSTPDRYFQGGNYLDMASRVLANQPGITPYGAGGTGTPTPKTEADFAILTRGGNPYAATPPSGYPDMAGSTSAKAGGSGTDPRIKMLKTLADASPPSTTGGYNDNDFAALRVAQAIYGMNLNPQQQASLFGDKTNLAINRSAGRRLGYDVESWEQRQRNSLPGQGSVRAA